ncbi:MAG: hypothetical protein JWP72_2627 [Massilia sp.]|nr:hypothetical protein [Massilia sp.]MDB5793559.1 hypothetical protein [Massilia sp.]
MTGASTLDPDNFPERPDRSLGKGHGTDALGPSDLSDTGSDVMGGPGFASNLDDDQLVHLDRGTNEEEESYAGDTAGPDVGDADFSSDSDVGGTGERAAAGRDTVAKDGADIDTDRIESIPDLPLTEEDTDFLASQPPGSEPSR